MLLFTGAAMKQVSLPMLYGAQLDSETILVSGDAVFFTRQGEGATMGEPAVFLRTNECNLDCNWCDTPYTWNRTHPSYSERTTWTLQRARDEILAATRDGCTRMVLTGGEPLLQQRRLAELAHMPEFTGWDIEIETNGTVVPDAFRGREKLQINCSPKLASSGVARERRIRPEVLRALAEDFRAYFKFVVGGAADLQEIDTEYMPLLAGVSGSRIFVSPEGRTVQRLDEVRNGVSEGVASRGWVLGDRQHIRLFGDRRRT